MASGGASAYFFIAVEILRNRDEKPLICFFAFDEIKAL